MKLLSIIRHPPGAFDRGMIDHTRRQCCDLLIVGGGILGLWIARKAVQAGLSIVVVDKGLCGAGASGGVLGALMPHTPTGWTDKKQFQFDALVELQADLRVLERETGRSTGYGRPGRLIPIRHDGFIAEAERRARAAMSHWTSDDQAFRHEIRDTADYEGWVDPSAAPHGLLHDSLSARLDPAATVAALKTSLARQGVPVIERCAFVRYDSRSQIAYMGDGTTFRAGRIVLAAGFETFDMLRDLIGLELGSGVKGQAAVFRGARHVPADAPILFDNGTYVIGHADGTVAVGSTTETSWSHPDQTDAQVDALVDRARAVCPALGRAIVIAGWAGVRPKCAARDPMIGPLSEDSQVWVATGGFKITFGIAARLAAWCVDGLVGRPSRIRLPLSFTPEYHIGSASGSTGRVSGRKS